MKAVLISIRPKWCEKIANGEKTVEIRKARPELSTPFKCYIYCTKAKYPHEDFITVFDKAQAFYAGGTVVGEFVCDKIVVDKTFGHNAAFLKEACLSAIDAAYYCTRPEMYGWHISKLKIYDQPKALSEFRQCHRCQYMGVCNEKCWNPLQRPPQSWCYVEELE